MSAMKQGNSLVFFLKALRKGISALSPLNVNIDEAFPFQNTITELCCTGEMLRSRCPSVATSTWKKATNQQVKYGKQMK